MTRHLTIALAALLCASPAALAQSKPSADRQYTVHVTKLFEAFNKEDWKTVAFEFDFLAGDEKFSEQVKKDKHILFLNAQARYHLAEKSKKFDLAARALEELLEAQSDHIGGLYLLAQVRAQSKSDADRARATELLIESARSGQFVLRDIGSPDGKKIFGEFLDDPEFILRLMTASRDLSMRPGELRNPFESPLREVGPEAGGEDDGSEQIATERLEQLEKRVEELFEQVEKLARRREVEELIGKFTELRAIMAEYGQQGSQVVREQLKKWNERLKDFAEIQRSIQLQIYINSGNNLLRAMAEAIKRDEYDAALEQFEQIKELKEQMFSEELVVFHRNAEAVFLRGKALAERAARLKQIAEFPLDITGIVVAPPEGDEEDKAIINDHIYAEGDTILDDQEEPIRGLRVVEIIPSTVRFRFEDTEFVRDLRKKAP